MGEKTEITTSTTETKNDALGFPEKDNADEYVKETTSTTVTEEDDSDDE